MQTIYFHNCLGPYQDFGSIYLYVVPLSANAPTAIMKHLYVLMSWPKDMDMLWFCVCFLFWELKLFHDSSYRQKVAGDINSLNLLVFEWIFLSFVGIKDTHKSLNELEYLPHPTTNYRVSCTWASKI